MSSCFSTLLVFEMKISFMIGTWKTCIEDGRAVMWMRNCKQPKKNILYMFN